MNNKGVNGYPTYDAVQQAAQQAAYQQYMHNNQMHAHAQLPPSYNSVVTSMTPTYPPYPPGVVPQPYYANSWSVNPSPQAQFAPQPPPYASAPAAVAAIPAQSMHPQMYQYQIAAAPPPQAQPPQVYQTPVYPVQGAMFDAGARFGKTGGQPTIPPPPPGIAPNAAQMASMHGQQVMMAKKKNNFLHGGNGGGYTFW
ncbi:DAZ-associated protein 2-like [Anopheles merus]|uniref:DAZ-associated protein 2 n=4 Tax=gambiae species complex TaxID=44542 RepID=Q7Q519_ANOGA|nr:DAZ-associated protein 2-like [Anopheles coluzzii]XP_041767878.1 DAZ-associated protein 2-like [Anopheles merus]XP_316720.4 DAZ-associated protein 2 [Anopheles gambiae]EAA11485.4 AGAP006681-PA [Anopheles gambiae str. PEST]